MRSFYHETTSNNTVNKLVSDFFKNFILNVKDYLSSQYLQLFFLILIVDIPYILIKIYWDNKIQTLFYIFLGLLIFIRIFATTQSDNEMFKTIREKSPNLSKQQIVTLIEKKKTHANGSFGICLLVLIFAYLLI